MNDSRVSIVSDTVNLHVHQVAPLHLILFDLIPLDSSSVQFITVPFTVSYEIWMSLDQIPVRNNAIAEFRWISWRS